MNFNNLKDLSREQLLEVAGKQGLSVHWKAKPETIIKQIIDHASAKPKQNPQDYDRKYVNKEPVYHTKEQIEEAIAPIKAQQPKFTTEYNEEEKTCKFSCLGAEETFNMSVPLPVLRKRASLIKRGRIAPLGHDTREWGSLPGTKPHSSYTNTVLAG